MAGKTAAQNLNEPDEHVNTEDANYQVIQDPLLAAPTVERDYSQGFKSQAGTADIPEPTIQPPNFDDPSPSPGFDSSSQDYDPQPDPEPVHSKKDDEYEDFGFELNGDTAIYIIDFLYKLFKEQYKITEETLVKHGLDKETFHARIIVENQSMTVAQFAEQVNGMMDEVNIPTKDKNFIKKIIVQLSKKHDVKMTPETQLVVVLAKIGLETHLQLKMIQGVVLERLVTMTPDYAASKAQNAETAPDLEDIARAASNIPTSEENEPVVVKEVTRTKSKKNGVKNKVITVENFIEPGEKNG